MRGPIGKLAAVVVTCACLFVLSVSAHAVNLTVNCDRKGVTWKGLTSINAALTLLNPQGPNTLTVYGTCNENVVIWRFNQLTLRGKSGATINDASGGTGSVVYIGESTEIEVQGFTINGGTWAVMCDDFTVCRLDGNTIQGASGVGIQVGMSRATIGANTIQNNGIGVAVIESGFVRTTGGLIVQQNQADGVLVDYGGTYDSFGDTIQNNAGSGIDLFQHGFLLLVGATIAGNSLYGVTVLGQSSADFEVSNSVTGNGASGVLLRDSSYVDFRASNTIIGNGGWDVECEPQFPDTRGVSAFANTNCTEPLTPAGSRIVQPQVRKPIR